MLWCFAFPALTKSKQDYRIRRHCDMLPSAPALQGRWHAVKVELNIFPFYSLQRETTGGNEEYKDLQPHGREAFVGDKVNKTESK